MGTNYDWTLPGMTDKHIGKLITEREGARAFTWAADPVQTMYVLFVLKTSREVCVVDEYGRRRTAQGMLSILLGCQRHDYNSVGSEFS